MRMSSESCLYLFLTLLTCATLEEVTRQKKGKDQGVLVQTRQGKLKGRLIPVNIKNEYFFEGLVGGFLGIPYAQPPIGQLRFEPPVEKESWEGILNAKTFGPICYQPGEQMIWDVASSKNKTIVPKSLQNYNMSEDCLTLNIYVPLIGNGTIDFNSQLPVFFYIHGGSYYMNGGRLYPGQILAASQNLIVVTFNYRLGPFGFLSTGDSEAPGNYGMLDQVLALEWVEKNIEQFGGDPKKITLVGNSAGGASVMFHMFSPLSQGKFVGVTVQSGCSGAPWALQLSPKKHAEYLASNLGCPTQPSKQLLDCIRSYSPGIIMKISKLEDGLSLAYAAVIDGNYGGQFLPHNPQHLIEKGEFAQVPVLTGFTKDEVTIWFTKFGETTKTKDLRSFVQLDVVSLLENIPTVTAASIAAMIHSVTVQYLYRAGIAQNDIYGKTSSVSDFISDVGLKAPCINEMNLLSEKTSKPVYLYEFNYFSSDDRKMNQEDWIGSYHESELQFIFGEPYLNFTNHLRTLDDKRMSDLMMKIWADFIRHGTPTPESSKEKDFESTEQGLTFKWPNYTEKNQDFVRLGLKSELDKQFLTNRMLFWNFFFPIFRDYPFQFNESGSGSCEEWEVLRESWTFWALAALTCCLLFFFTLFISQMMARKFRRSQNPTPTITYNNSNSNNSFNHEPRYTCQPL